METSKKNIIQKPFQCYKRLFIKGERVGEWQEITPIIEYGDTATSEMLIDGSGYFINGAIYIVRSNGNNSFYYAYADNIGSLTALVNENGTVAERYAYDPWGLRRNPDNWTETDGRTTWLVNRGYTGHEMLDKFSIINMNGRVYDPYTAMFFSPDPFVNYPSDWLNYNRYGYAMNNPFKFTDPDGEHPLLIAALVGALIGGASYTASVAFSDGGFDNWNLWQFGKSMFFGAVSGVITSGIGSAFGAVGSNGIMGEIARAYTHGFANGMISYVSGGDPLQGFAAGALGSLAGSAFMMYGGDFSNSTFGVYAFSGLAGGAGAELTGGNFWQGAGIGLMTAGLNHLGEHVAFELTKDPNIPDLTEEFKQQLRDTRKTFTELKEYYKKLAAEYASTGQQKLAIHFAKMANFIELVKNKGAFDLKNQDDGWGTFGYQRIPKGAYFKHQLFQADDFGNMNFGVAGKAYGYSLGFLKFGAGMAQIWAGTSHWRYRNSYFDNPRDQIQIQRGYNVIWY